MLQPGDARTGIVAALVAVVCAIASVYFGEGYVGFPPNHRGYFLVPVEDRIAAPIPRRPRHAVLIVVDGLRRDAAETMTSARRIAERGHCRVSDQGTYTISRPEYALLSTGLEVERNGTRNNEWQEPLGAESIWEVARANGLRVAGSSHLSWFHELFPAGFDRFTVARSHEVDVFDVPELADVDVFHPLYVDEAAHHHRATSARYAAAVDRADREIGRLLDRLDLTQDVVVLTSDHGHLDQGGHGGPQPEVRYVLACFGGPNVARLEGRPSFDGRNTAPLLAMLLGVPFPKHMSAGEDSLDAIFEATSFGPDAAGYVSDRRAAVERFRDANRVALEGWLGGPPGTWARLREREGSRQTWWLASCTALFCVLGASRLRLARAYGPRTAVASALWISVAFASVWGLHRIVMGELDFSAINVRETFFPRMITVVGVATVATVGAHGAIVRRLSRFVYDGTTLLLLLLVMNASHRLVYGWPLRFPLPSPGARYFPLVGSFALMAYALVTLALAVVLVVRARRLKP